MIRPNVPLPTSPRNFYIPCHYASQGQGGAMNSGIVVTKHSGNHCTYIEKRVPPKLITSLTAEYEIAHMQYVMQRNNNIAHPNIVFIADHDLSWEKTGYGSIFMQHCELGSLDGVIIRHMDQGRFLADEGFVWKVLWDLSLALCFLWTGNDNKSTRELAMQGASAPIHWTWNYILHCDIKPSNVFLTWAHRADGSPYPTAVLGDFGCSVTLDDLNEGLACYGDRQFAAPEAPDASCANDVYGLGLIAHCLGLMVLKPEQDLTLREDCPFGGADVSQDLEYLVGKCLSENPDDRPYPQDLPKLVWSGYLAWRVGRDDAGAPLPNWAFPSAGY